MDEICRKLSDIILSAGNGGYAVFYEDELLEAMPSEDSCNRDLLEAALKKLRSGGYIDVRYARGNAFCLAGIKPYETPAAETAAPPLPPRGNTHKGRAAFFTLVSAFLGGALGSALYSLLAALVF